MSNSSLPMAARMLAVLSAVFSSLQILCRRTIGGEQQWGWVVCHWDLGCYSLWSTVPRLQMVLIGSHKIVGESTTGSRCAEHLSSRCPLVSLRFAVALFMCSICCLLTELLVSIY